MHKEIFNWLDSFQEAAIKESTVNLANLLVQLGVENPEDCSCTEFDLDGEDDILMSCHQNHRVFNRLVWFILFAFNRMEGIRKVIEKDLTKETDLEGFGEIVRKDYGQQLLDNFLVPFSENKWI